MEVIEKGYELEDATFGSTVSESQISVNNTAALPSSPRDGGSKRSPFFPESAHSVPFPSLKSRNFGLIQEHYVTNSFQLLVCSIMLNQTKGKDMLPFLQTFFVVFPSPKSLVECNSERVRELVQKFGLQNIRSKRLINLARQWCTDPPRIGQRYRTLHYPSEHDGKDIRPFDVLDEDDNRNGAWEIGHLHGIGPYGFDCWRIFCRDVFRKKAYDWNGGGAGPLFEPEWKRVVPQDKELRVFVQWAWLREGFIFDVHTGNRRPASRTERQLFETNQNFDLIGLE